MKLFSNNIVPYASAEGDKIYPIVVDIKKGIKSGEAISFVTADNQVGVITVDFMDGNSSYSIEGCMVTATIRRPDGTVLEIPCDIISQSTIEIPLGINGTYQEGVHTFDLKIVRGNGKIIGVPTMSYSVSGSLSSDGVVEGDDRLPVLTMVLDNAQDKLARLDKAIAEATNDLEVKEARDGEVTLNARLERDLANTNRELEKIKKLEESTVSTIITDSSFTTVAETTQGYFEDVKIEGKTLVNLWEHTDNVFTQTSPSRQLTANSLNLLKPNTTYTCMLTLSNVDIDYSIGSIYAIEYINNSTEFKVIPDGTTNGCKIFTFTTLAYDITRFHIGIHGNNSEGKQITFSNVIILEGDHTDKDISFFEGLKSVGQDTDGIEISSQNKNILPIEELKKYIGNGLVKEGLTFNVTDNKIIVNGTSNNIWDFRPINASWTPKFFKLINSLPIGTSIRLNNNLGFNNYWVVTRNGTVNYLENTITIQQGDSDINGFVRIPQGYSFENNQELQLQIEIGANATNYVTPKIHKKEILCYNPNTETWEKPVLREWDSIEKHNDGKYYYHKRSEEIVLNGSENWALGATSNSALIELWGDNVLDKAYGGKSGEFICDILPEYTNSYDTECINLYNASHSNKAVGIKLSTQKATDLQTGKQWLQANPTTVVYQLAQEEVYECTNLDLITYQNETNLIVSSGAIQPRITLKVLSNVSNVVKLLQEKVSILENKFIKGLQQVLAGDMMSLAHLLYPEDFEHEIQTLEL